ncbi:MAG TPA: sugar phosphate isomerase/epimerase family protein [bacterium]|nr:sugar phosphate isomerase/epimerase family protein [bacterium]
MSGEIGIRSSSCLNKDGLFTKEQIPVVKNAGFSLLELNFNNPETGLDCDDTKILWGLKQEAEHYSIKLSAHAPRDISLAIGDKTEDGRIVRIYTERIQRMAEYGGIDSIVLHPGGSEESFGLNTERMQIRNCISRIEKIIPVCEKNKVTLLLETMTPVCVFSKMDNLIEIVDSVGSLFLKICLDTNHLSLSEDICDAAKRAGKRICKFHLNDNHYGIKEEHLLPYSGDIDWDAFISVLVHYFYGVDMILEPSRLHNGKFYEPKDTALMLKQARKIADRILREMREKRINKKVI